MTDGHEYPKTEKKKDEKTIWGENSIDALVDAEFDLFCALRFNEMCDGKALSTEQVKMLLSARKAMQTVIEQVMSK